MTLKLRLAVAFIILGLMGCEHARMTFSGFPDTKYHQTLQTMTKYERLYGLDKALYETYITYMSPELADQYVEEYAKVFALNDLKKQAMLDEAHANQAKYDDFLVVHYASERDNITLSVRDPANVVWKFYLRTSDDNNGLIEASDINNVALGTQKKYFYPHINEWSKLYRVRFLKTSSPEKRFVMKGPIRELTFNWK